MIFGLVVGPDSLTEIVIGLGLLVVAAFLFIQNNQLRRQVKVLTEERDALLDRKR
ncbi:MAG: hypothetical protein K2P88_06625 [Chitinophagaceae bacterium]|uniref:hypothetical protein n=1 Tax=unclassified Paraflavitalea TaxID=2798305 RepID=UPI003D329D26|nr:hypothetical protein [Chitinophagaceae bacterium]